jgi:organic hydroperoxide reductase OsmC/OhrA
LGVVTVELRNVAGTGAAVGWAGARTVVVDRPAGRAGGSGMGFNGAELLALAIGGCFCNDLRYVAHDRGIELAGIAVSVSLELDGEPLVATRAAMTVSCQTADGSDPAPIVDGARAICMVANSLMRGVPVAIAMAADGRYGTDGSEGEHRSLPPV